MVDPIIGARAERGQEAGDEPTPRAAQYESRRQSVALLFCDLVASTALMDRVGEDLADEIRRDLFAFVRHAIAAHGGDEVKAQGDGLMASFGASVDALDCAGAMHTGVARLSDRDPSIDLHLRIGLAWGMAVFDAGDWYGVPVVEAARLCAIAASDETLMTESVVLGLDPARAAGTHHVGPLSLKGFSAALPVFGQHVLGAAPVAARAPEVVADGEPDLVGRAGELAALEAALERVIAGEPRGVFLVGEAGAGKSRIVAELVERFATRGVRVLAGSATHPNDPYAAWCAVIRWWALSEDPAGARSHLGDVAPVLAAVVPVVTLRSGVPPATGVSPADVSDAIAELVGTFREPVMVVLDDWHQADPASVAILGDLLLHPRSRLLIVAIGRSTPTGGVPDTVSAVVQRVGDGPSTETIVLDDLPQSAIESMVAAAAPRDLPAVSTLVRRESGGNPRAAVELLRHLRSHGLLGRTSDAQWWLGANAVAATTSPYRGLLAYDVDDRAVFFGRAELSTAIVDRISNGERLIALVGASGSGKSSLARAGVIATLRTSGWRTEVRTGSMLTVDGVRSVARAAEPTVLLIDQLEELFVDEDADRARTILDRLLAMTRAEPAIAVVLAVRADFYGHLAASQPFADAVSAATVLVPGPAAPDLRAAIEGPAAVAGLRLEPGLSEALLAEVANEPGGLPLLSHALLETWRRRRGRVLTLAGYREAGGARGAIAQTAESVYTTELDDEGRTIARSLLLRLVNPGEGTLDTRRPAFLDDLPTEARTTLDQLVTARLVAVDEGRVEIAHEALIGNWPRLREWIEEDREALRVQGHLSAAAREWATRDHSGTDLYRGTRLDVAAEQVDAGRITLGAREQEFVRASLAARDRERVRERRARRRLRWLLVTTSIALVVALIGAAFAVTQRRRADTRSAQAELQKTVAQSAAIGPDDPTAGALLAVEASRRSRSALTRGALIGALEAAPNVLQYAETEKPTPGAAAISDDGSILAALYGTDVLFWSTRSFTQVAPPIRGSRDPSAIGTGVLTISGDGRMAAVGRLDGTIELWRIASHERVGTVKPALDFSNSNNYITTLALSRDGSRLGVGLSAGLAQVFDTAAQRALVPPTKVGAAGSVDAAFCPGSGALIFAAADENASHVFVTRRAPGSLRLLVRSPSVPAADTGGMHCSADGHTVALATTGGGASVFDARDGRLVAGPFNVNPYSAAATAGGAQILVTQMSTGLLYRFDGATGSQLGDPTPTGSQLPEVIVAPDGRRAFVVSRRITVISLDGSTPLGPAVPGTAHTLGASVSPDGRTLAVLVGGARPRTRFVERASGRDVATVPGRAVFADDGSILTVDAAGHGRRGTVDRPAASWRGQVLQPGPFSGWVASADGSMLVTSSGNGALNAYDAHTGRHLAGPILQGAQKPIGFAVSDDGDRLAVAWGGDGSVKFYDPRTLEHDGKPIVADFAGGAMRFTRDGRRLVIGGASGIVGVGDVDTRRLERTVLRGHTGKIASLTLLDDGTTLVTTAGDRTIRAWDLHAGIALGRAITAAGSGNAIVSSRGHIALIPTPGGIVQADLGAKGMSRRVCARAGQNFNEQTWLQYFPNEPYRRTCPQFARPPAATQ